MVKFIPGTSNTWFLGTDQLAGTFETGTQGSTTAEWAIKFQHLTFNSFLFTTENFHHWAIAPKASI